jgi:hypothetical protein
MRLKNNFLLYSIFLLSFLQFSAQTTIIIDSTKVLYNGIELPEVWPPEYDIWQERKSMPLPYLENPPAVIPINTGRQLFVDSFLIASTNLNRVHHQPEYYQENPVLEPSEDWEYNTNGPYASPFSDGVWYDEQDGKYKMWYLTGAGKDQSGLRTAYAESKDGLNWEKPNLGIFGNTNIVENTNRDAATVWLDKMEPDPSKRYKMFMIQVKPKFSLWPMILKYSSDGINWGKNVALSGGMYDRSTVFYNPFRSKWVLSMKVHSPIGRAKAYLEHSDEKAVVSLAHKFQYDTDIHDFKLEGKINDANIKFWFGADKNDPRHPKFPKIEPQIYNHDAIAYESITLGFFTVWQGPENKVADSLGIQKRNEVLIGYSRDGFHWDRSSHDPFMGVNEAEGAWNWGNVQSVVGTPIIKGDSLYFYVSGRRLSEYMWDSYTSTGLATMRRDGFVSMNSNKPGKLLTRNLSFDGKYLFVNADVEGSLQVEVLDQYDKVIKGYSRAESVSFKGDSTKHMITWKGMKDLNNLKGKPVKFRFYLDDGEIYSFWVSPWETGESRGYTAGGGPGLSPSGIDVPHKNNSN